MFTKFKLKNAAKQKSLFGARSRNNTLKRFPLMGCRCSMPAMSSWKKHCCMEGFLPFIHLGNKDSTLVCPETLWFSALKMKYREKKGSAPPCLWTA